jgi:hypothetical protein
MCIKYFSSSLLSFYRWYKIPLRVPACDRPDTEENGNIEYCFLTKRIKKEKMYPH